MPKVPLHALRWSRGQELYELSTQGQVVRHFRPGDEAAWQTWLRTVTSLTFHSPSGSLNVYQEARPRGGQYWYAYHTERGRTRKRYLGRTAQALAPAHAQVRSPAAPPLETSSPAPEPELLLVTKLVPPHVSHTLVERERLLTALDGAFSTPLTLLSASAGWGKTTLLSHWASRHPNQVAWLSLDVYGFLHIVSISPG